jgi:membrane-associated phospholipid phosphatase
MVCHGALGWALALLPTVAAALLVVMLAPRLVRWPALQRWELSLADRIVRLHQPRTIALFGDVSALGSSTLVAVVAVAAALAFALGGHGGAAWTVVLAPALAGPLGTLLKRLTRRERPGEPMGLYFGSSMPSNHTLMATVLYGTVALQLLALLPPGHALAAFAVAAAALVIAGVAVSRVLLRVHHPTDVGAALLIGAALLVAVALRPWACP